MENRELPSTTYTETLIRRGWCFRDVEELKGLIQIHIATVGNVVSLVDSIEKELLLNMDLRSIGGKTLPNDPSLMEKISHLQGPKVLQVVSTRDISQSSIEASSGSSNNRRLLLICLTDGYSEIAAIEYSPITSIQDDIVPGTKVRLESRVAMRSGIVCLNPNVVTVLGGVVQTLYEEWEMNRKYSGFSRSSLKPQSCDDAGPPPFEKLQIDKNSQKTSQRRTSFLPELSSKVSGPALVKVGENSDSQEVNGKKSHAHALEKDVDMKAAVLNGQKDKKPSNPEFRPKEVSEAVPVQNQAAAQKLLQKVSQTSHNERHLRGPKHRKGKDEETAVFTLDEWEKRKSEVKLPTGRDREDLYHDEELAWQLQKQLDLEDLQAQTSHESEAEKIRMSMFNFHKMEEDRNQGRSRSRGRGRGRGRGRRFG